MSERSQPFTDMAFRVERNDDQEFGGAFVIMPPGEDAKPIQLLMLDNARNPAVFLGTLQTMIQMAIQDMEDQQRNADPFSRMR